MRIDLILYSSSARKLFKKGEKLNWPQSGVSSEDKESVKKLGKLKVWFMFSLLYTFMLVNSENKKSLI